MMLGENEKGQDRAGGSLDRRGDPYEPNRNNTRRRLRTEFEYSSDAYILLLPHSHPSPNGPAAYRKVSKTPSYMHSTEISIKEKENVNHTLSNIEPQIIREIGFCISHLLSSLWSIAIQYGVYISFFASPYRDYIVYTFNQHQTMEIILFQSICISSSQVLSVPIETNFLLVPLVFSKFRFDCLA